MKECLEKQGSCGLRLLGPMKMCQKKQGGKYDT